MPLSELSVSTQNYLKEIWSLEEWTKTPATASALAERMGLRISSVSDGLKRLAAADLIEHQPYGTIELTEIGRAYALAMIRRHRLIETFLVETLGYTWDRVHDEAEVLEHAVSDFMVDRIDTLLGHPTRDPHGDPIPDSSGYISFPQTVPLSQCEPGETVMLERINDEDPRLLRYLHGHGFVPGAHLKVEEGAPFSEAVNVSVVGAGSGTRRTRAERWSPGARLFRSVRRRPPPSSYRAPRANPGLRGPSRAMRAPLTSMPSQIVNSGRGHSRSVPARCCAGR